MGWTYQAKPDSPKAFLDSQCAHESETVTYEVLRSAFVGLTYYAAVKRTDKATDTSYVFAAVILVRYTRDRDYNFGHKGMDETMGPSESKCPQTILALLTATDSDYANQWRERCADYHAGRTKPIAVGTVLRYGGVDYRCTEKHGRAWLVNRVMDGARFRMGQTILAESQVVA